MAGRALRLPHLILFGLACFVTVSCGSKGTPQQAKQPPEEDTLYLGLTAREAETAVGAVQQALETKPSEQTLDWNAPSGPSGSVTPLRTFKITTGHYCRDYREVVLRDDVPVTALRRACRARDGVWRSVPMGPNG